MTTGCDITTWCDWWPPGVTNNCQVWQVIIWCDWWPPGVTNNCHVWLVIIWFDWSPGVTGDYWFDWWPPGVTNNCQVWLVIIWYDWSPGVTNNCQVWQMIIWYDWSPGVNGDYWFDWWSPGVACVNTLDPCYLFFSHKSNFFDLLWYPIVYSIFYYLSRTCTLSDRL